MFSACRVGGVVALFLACVAWKSDAKPGHSVPKDHIISSVPLLGNTTQKLTCGNYTTSDTCSAAPDPSVLPEQKHCWWCLDLTTRNRSCKSNEARQEGEKIDKYHCEGSDVTMLFCPGGTSERECNRLDAPDGSPCMWCTLQRDSESGRTTGKNCYRAAAREQLVSRGWRCDNHDGLSGGATFIVTACAVLFTAILALGISWKLQWPPGLWAKVNGYHNANEDADGSRAGGSYQHIDFQA